MTTSKMGKEGRRNSRQADFEDVGASGSGAQRSNMIYYTEKMVPQFNGQDKTQTAARWVQDVEDNAEIFGLTPLQQLIVGRRALIGTAALWLRSEKPFKTWDELKAGVLKEFPDTVDIKSIHEAMTKRKKKPGESCIDYLLVMKELGKRGKMPDYVAIKYIIDGIVDIETNKIMLYGATTYSELKEKLKIYDAVKEKMTVEKRKSTNSNTGTPNSNSYGKNTDLTLRRCYSCGENQHVSSQCPHKEKGLKCFRCNQFGHIAAECINNNRQRGSSGEQVDPRNDVIGGPGTRHNSQQRHVGTKRTMFTTSDCTVGSTSRLDNMADAITENTKMAASELTHDIDSDMSGRNVMQIDLNKQTLKKPIKTIEILDKTTTALIDTGSEVNLITDEQYACIGSPKYDDGRSVQLTGLGQSEVIPLGRVLLSVKIDSDYYNNVLFYVVNKCCLPYNVIIGQDFLKRVLLVMKDGCVRLHARDDEWLRQVECLSCDVTGYVGDKRYKSQIMKLVESYKPEQMKEAPIQLKIVLKDDIPVAQRPRRLSLVEQKVVEQQVTEWLQNNIIQVSYSEYASPLVLVKKKDGNIRVCVDYRLINKKMVKDEYPLPIIEDLIDKLQSANVYSVLDLKNGFFHLRVCKESVKYTAFVTHHGQYEFLRAPFGLMNCPKYFMRFVSIIFRELISKGVVIIFIDDILIPAQNEIQALQRLKEVLDVASEYGLQFNWSKARLMCSEVEYLGHLIKNGEVRPSPDKVDAVIKYPEPKCFKQLHSFIGLTSYFRKYIENYAIIAKPLTDKLKKDVNFIFDKEEKVAFHNLKQKLVCGPVLKIYNPKLSTELHTDASSVALAAILMQQHDDGLHPIHYMSKRTTEAESKYSSYELEALAIVEGVRKFRQYLYGVKFKIITDCQAFQLTLRKKDLSTRVARWVLLLDEYDYDVEHRSGHKMKHVDALSRIPYTVALVSDFHDQLRRSQMNDDGLKAIMEILKESSYEDYILDNGLLYKGLQKRLVIPKNMENEVLQIVHSRGHFAKKKMTELLCQDYYIKNLDKKIEEFILSCIPCLLATRKAGKQEGWLNSIEKEGIPMHTLHCDHVGPLSQTKKQYNYILTVVDAFTKFVWLFPTKSTTSKETIDKLLILQQTFGNPTVYVTDRGTAFTSGEFKGYCEDENIRHITITTGVPRSNGQVERIHRILISVLTKLSISEPGAWYKHVSKVQRALNSTYQRAINTTPFELLLGTKMKSKDDLQLYNIISEEMQNCFTESRDDLRRSAKECILKIQEENQKGYNRGRKESTKYKEGDLVAIKRTQFGPCLKLKPKFLGPYEIKKVKRNDRYDMVKIDPGTEGPGRTSSSADNMKRWPNND